MKVAATYVRASTELQVYSTSNQIAALEQYASRNDIAIIRAYADDGRSGLDLEGRPGLLKLLQDVLQPHPPFQVLLVYDVRVLSDQTHQTAASPVVRSIGFISKPLGGRFSLLFSYKSDDCCPKSGPQRGKLGSVSLV